MTDVSERDERAMAAMNDLLFLARVHRRHQGLADDAPVFLELPPLVLGLIGGLVTAELLASFSITLMERQ